MDLDDFRNHSTLSVIIKVDYAFRAYVSPLLALFGIIGNVLVIIVFSRIKRNRFAVYSSVLAVVNIFILFFNTFLDDFLGRGIYYATSGRFMAKIDLISTTSCRLMNFIPNAMYCANAYIILALSMDRCLVLVKPIKYTVEKGVKEAIWTCFAIILLASVLNLPLLFTYRLEFNSRINNSLERILNPEYECSLDKSFFAYFELYCKSIFTLALPTGVIVCLNSYIIVTLLTRYSNHPFIIRGTNSQTEQARFIGHLAVSCLFTILFLPLSIVIILRLSHDEKSLFNYSHLKALSKLLSSIKDISFAGNIFLYILFMPHFRYKVKNLLLCQCKPRFFRCLFSQICFTPLRITLLPVRFKDNKPEPTAQYVV